MQKYDYSPTPIKTIFDVIELAISAREGDYEAHKRLKNAEEAARRRQKERAQDLQRRRELEIEDQLRRLREAITAVDESSEIQALKNIRAVLRTMSVDEQKRAWASIIEWNFCGNYKFIEDHYAAQAHSERISND